MANLEDILQVVRLFGSVLAYEYQSSNQKFLSALLVIEFKDKISSKWIDESPNGILFEPNKRTNLKCDVPGLEISIYGVGNVFYIQENRIILRIVCPVNYVHNQKPCSGVREQLELVFRQMVKYGFKSHRGQTYRLCSSITQSDAVNIVSRLDRMVGVEIVKKPDKRIFVKLIAHQDVWHVMDPTGPTIMILYSHSSSKDKACISI